MQLFQFDGKIHRAARCIVERAIPGESIPQSQCASSVIVVFHSKVLCMTAIGRPLG
jgi:hypothetical protein